MWFFAKSFWSRQHGPSVGKRLRASGVELKSQFELVRVNGDTQHLTYSFIYKAWVGAEYVTLE